MPVITAPLLADTYVDSAQPDSALYGRRLVVGIDGDDLGSYPWGDGVGSGGMCRAWIRFDLSSIPTGSTINSATLLVPTYWAKTAYNDFTYWIVRSTNITWDQLTMTYNDAPNVTLDEGTAISVNQGQGNAAISTSVTPLVASALAAGKVSFALISDQDFNAYDSDMFMDVTSFYYVDNYNPFVSACSLSVNYTVPSRRRSSIIHFP